MADLFGTYDKRIKFTVDHTKIDSDLTWFPVTVQLDSGQGEEVFTEFDADEDFDRIAFTTSDGETQLYADCELFDDSESKAIYHVSKTGWSIDNDTDTDFYMYYDNDAGHNTTYISKSGGTAAQSVWDGNFKAVYHMQDGEYDVLYDCESTTPWDEKTGGTLTVDTDNHLSGDGCLKFVTNAEVGEGYFQDIFTAENWSTKTHIKVWMKGDSAESGQMYIWNSTSHYERWDFTYPTEWTLMEFDLSDPDGDDGTGLGSYTNIIAIRFDINAAEKTARYDKILSCPQTLTIIDSTSNANYGTKKGASEPVEATGKVGQGQDFDGTNDYIDCGDVSATEGAATLTIEAIINADTFSYASDAWSAIVGKRITGGVGPFALQISEHNQATADKIRFIVSNTTPTYGIAVADDILSTDTDYYLAGVYDGAHVTLYINAVAQTVVGDLTGNTNATTESFKIGLGRSSFNEYFNGTEDEIRVSSVRTLAWIKATYNSLYDTLLTYGDEETAGGDTEKLSGTSVNAITTSGAIGVSLALSGTSINTISTSGNLGVTLGLSGTSAITLSTSSELGLKYFIAGTSEAYVDAVAGFLNNICSFAGTSSCVISTTGELTLGAIENLSGTSISSISTIGIINNILSLSGTSATVVSTLGVTSATANFTGTSSTVFSTVGVLAFGSTNFIGTSATVVSTTGNLNAVYKLSGTSSLVVSDIGLLSAVRNFSGTSASVISTIASIGGMCNYSGTSTTTFSTVGALEVGIRRFSGTSASAITTSGVLLTVKKILGTSAITVSTIAELTLGKVEKLSGTSACTVSATAELDILKSFSGMAAVAISTVGVLLATIAFYGTSSSVVATTGDTLYCIYKLYGTSENVFSTLAKILVPKWESSSGSSTTWTAEEGASDTWQPEYDSANTWTPLGRVNSE